MTDTTEISNIVPVRPLDEVAALDWLRAQPGGSTTLPAAALARRWGWPEHRARRRLSAWHKSGLVRRRGRAVVAVSDAVGRTADQTAHDVALEAVGNHAQRVNVAWKNSPSVRRAAQAAGQAFELIEFPSVGRFVEPSAEPVMQSIAAPDEPPPPPPAAGRIAVVFYAAALALAAASAGFSITGMTSIFVGAFWPVIGMGIALEIGKLSAVAALPTLRWGGLKGALIALIAVLMALNAIGAYGFLAKAHIASAVAGETAVAGRAADIEARLAVQAGVVADLDRRIAQIDKAVETATQRGRTAGAMQLAGEKRRNRADLAAERVRQGKALADLQVEKADVEGQRKVAEADLGPVKYLATLLGAGDQDVLRWFILAVAMLLDPAAVLLLLAAASARRR